VRYLARCVEGIQKHEGEIQLVGPEYVGGDPVSLVLRLGIGGARRQVVQYADLPLALDLRSRLLHDVEHARDPSVIVWNGTVGKREVRFLRHGAALDEELKILRPGGGPPVLDAPGHWPGDVPDFGPDLGGRSRQ
jgi:hypothetical protein